MVALKKEGMTTRHWKAISEEIGGEPIDPDLDEDFCFATCLKKGLLSNNSEQRGEDLAELVRGVLL